MLSLINAFASACEIKFTHFYISNVYSLANTKGEQKSGRIGPKSKEYLSTVDFNKSLSLLSTNSVFNRATDDGFSLQTCCNNIYISLVKNKSIDIDIIKKVAYVIGNENINFAFAFSTMQEASPDFMLSGIEFIDDDLKFKGSLGEHKLINSISDNRKRVGDYRLPYILPIMYIKVKDNKTLIDICSKLNYKFYSFEDGFIIDTSVDGDYTVQLMMEDNKLFKFLECSNIAFFGSKNDEFIFQK
jgi:hypothetical protein